MLFMLIFTFLFLPLLWAITIVFCLPFYKIEKIKSVALLGSLFVFFGSCFFFTLCREPIFLEYSRVNTILSVYFVFNTSLDTRFFYTNIVELSDQCWILPIGIDSLSLSLIVLTTFLIPICILTGWQVIKINIKEYMLCFLFIEFFLIGVFSIQDLLIFFLLFEAVLIPIYVLILLFGSKERRFRAAYKFFLFTLAGSSFLFIGIIIIYVKTKSLNIVYLPHLLNCIDIFDQKFLWFLFFLGFAVKVPIVPFHIWLPEAHAEAPTGGSVILAGILLKLGTYGILRINFIFLPEASYYFSPLVFIISILGIIYISIVTLVQVDIKKIIAYSSVAHMGFVTLGIFSYTIQGIQGAIFLIISHGLVSGALFYSVGILYERYKSRSLKYYSGLVTAIPLYVMFVFLFTLANIGCPGTSSFVGEFLILTGTFSASVLATVLASVGIILSAAYALWIFNRISFSNMKLNYINEYRDCNKLEFYILFIFTFFIIFFGIYPEAINCYLNYYIQVLLVHPLEIEGWG